MVKRRDLWTILVMLGAGCVVAGCDEGCPEGQAGYADDTSCHPLCETVGAPCTASTGASGSCLPAGANGVIQRDAAGGLPATPTSAVSTRKLCMPSCVFAEGGTNRVAAVDGGTPPEGICPTELQCTWVAGSIDPGAALIAACLPR